MNAKIRHRRRYRLNRSDPKIEIFSPRHSAFVIVRKSDYDNKPSRRWNVLNSEK
jgi:hypothetical protein